MLKTKCPEKPDEPEEINPRSIERITQEIQLFTKTWLGFTPTLLDIDYHSQGIAVTMSGILADAEKNALKHKGIPELIAKNHISAYKSVRHILETKVAEFSGKTVAGSTLMLDPESNCATLVIRFE